MKVLVKILYHLEGTSINFDFFEEPTLYNDIVFYFQL